MTTEEIKKAFDDSILKDVEYIVVTGGEPTLRSDLKEVYDILHKACPKATLQLSTNGLLPFRVIDAAQHCLKEGMKFDVGISLDGIGKAHDEIRGRKGNFQEVEAVIYQLKLLQEDYPDQMNICLGMTISSLTTPKNYEMIKTFAKVSGLPLEYAWVEQTPYYDNDNKELGISKEGTELIVKDLPDSKRKEDWLRDINGKSIRFDCFALRTFFVLKYNGEIAPCLHYYNKTIGNVKEQSISQILSSDRCKNIKKYCVKRCDGCLNTWAYAESHMAKLTPYMRYYLTHPRALKRDMKW